MIKGLIFDMDGTLFDSLPMWEKVDERYLASLGISVTAEISRQFFHLSLIESARFIKEHFHVNKSVEEIRQGVVSLAAMYYREEVPLKKGAIEVLKAAESIHLPMTIATSNNRMIVDQVLKKHHLGHYFIKVLTAEEEGVGKTSPQIYRHACDYLQTRPSETLVFEDALHALKTAHAAHFKTVGCFDAYSQQDQPMIKKIADYYVTSLDEILDVISFRGKLIAE